MKACLSTAAGALAVSYRATNATSPFCRWRLLNRAQRDANPLNTL